MDRELDSDGDCLSDREEQSRIWEGGFLPGRILTSEVVVPEPPPFIHDVELADVDGDGDDDFIRLLDGKITIEPATASRSGLEAPRVLVEEVTGLVFNVFDVDDDGDLDLMTSSPARRAFVWFPQLEDPLVFGSERVIPYNLNTNTGSGVQLIRWADIYLTQIAARATGASTRIQTGTWVAYLPEQG